MRRALHFRLAQIAFKPQNHRILVYHLSLLESALLPGVEILLDTLRVVWLRSDRVCLMIRIAELDCILIEKLLDAFSLVRREIGRRLFLRERNESVEGADLAVKMFLLFSDEGVLVLCDFSVRLSEDVVVV